MELKRGLGAGRLLFIFIGILLFSVIVSAGSVTILLEDQVSSKLGSDGLCGRDSSSGGWIDSCNTLSFTGYGPAGCAKSSVIDSGFGGCYFWQPDNNPQVDVISRVNLDVSDNTLGTLSVGTANFGGGTMLRERVNVYVNGKYIGTTKDPYCNDASNVNCFNKGPSVINFSNVSFVNGINKVRFQSVADGGSVWVIGYQINYPDAVCTPGSTEKKPCGNCGFKTRTCNANGQWGEFSECQAQGVCSPGSVDSKTCGTDVGVCTIGSKERTCTDSCSWTGYSACSGIPPSTEVCDTLDNDCDGVVDEGNICTVPPFCGNGIVEEGEECEGSQTQTIKCGTDEGVCTIGDKTRTCNPYQCKWKDYGVCSGTPPSQEVCDTLDNDCDGETDEGDICEPSSFCGDGILNPGEQCDDGNNENGDGCSSECTIEYECSVDSDCNDLDREYCDGSTITTVDGVCNNHVCEVSETPVEDCSLRNGITGQCGILGWSCSEELNEVVCVITDVTPDNSYCDTTCSGDSLYEGTCDPQTYLCDYEVTDCSELNSQYCSGSNVVEKVYTCEDEACRLEYTDETECNDGLFCNGVESCSDGYCTSGNTVNCSINNIPGIASCDYVPDGNNATFDYRESFVSSCNEATDSCTSGNDSINHFCSVDACNAQCDDDWDCSATECDYLDGCDGNDYYDYSDVNNACSSSCGCEINSCADPVIYHNDPRCSVPTCGNGIIDDGEVCDGNSETVSCGADTGVCTTGNKTRSCNEWCEWDGFSQCTGVGPSQEVCDSLDNDCDGETDEGNVCPVSFCGDGVLNPGEECEGNQSETISCGTNEGVCTIGDKTRTCNAATCEWNDYGVCSGIPPAQETCDYLDNDCDGQTDEGLTITCTDYNTCGTVQVCANSCPNAPAEVCNQIDDNCNGQIDEGNVCGPVCGNGIVESGEECEIGDVSARTCGTSTGVCTVGSQSRSCNAQCEWNDYGVCSGIPPAQETCDYLDNDCDGETDESLTITCTDYNTCGTVQVCANSCPNAPAEVCNQIDDDCDGIVDEGNVCGPVCGNGIIEDGEVCDGNSETVSCGTDEGTCSVGTKTRNCNNSCEWNDYGVCSDIGPSQEVCDQLDNNCNGVIDENYACAPPGVCENEIEIKDDYSLRGTNGVIDYIGPYDTLDTELVEFSAVVNDVNSPNFRGYVTLSLRGESVDGKRILLRVKGQPTEIVQNVCTEFKVLNTWWSQNTYSVQGQAPITVTFDEIGYEWDRDTNKVNIYGIGPDVDFKVDDIPAICLNCE